MIDLSAIQNRFEQETDKKKWSKIQRLLFAESKENIVMGMNLLETLDEQVYYDGICSWLVDDGNENWLLSPQVQCENPWVLIFEIVRMVEENTGHEIHQAGQQGYFRKIWLLKGEVTAFGDMKPSAQEILLHQVKEMVWIPAGTFLMGKISKDNEDHGDETPRHKVVLERAFLVMKYAVAQALFASILDRNYSSGATLPLDHVSWRDCINFANIRSEQEGLDVVYEIQGRTVHMNEKANGYRLLTEAEWEYAARGGEYHLFSGSDDFDEVGWAIEGCNQERYLRSVGLQKANGYGLYDMSGNVFEWVWDRYGGYMSDVQVDPTGPERGDYHVLRGGFWNKKKWSFRVSARFFFEPTKRKKRFGFRLARTPYANEVIKLDPKNIL
jgi:formylglycine-generating enzyme required for sulfatase activity